MTFGSGPVGIFDSGVGGLTVVDALLKRFPSERVLYVADQFHVPYGGRPLEEIRGFATEISRFLADEGCRAVLMACNISSAVALDSVRGSLAPLPVYGMIESVARRAATDSRIGVLATKGTVKSGAYARTINRLSTSTIVTEQACPDFVPLVESGETESEAASRAAREYLAPLHAAGCTRIILGCTHYPYLLSVLETESRALWGRALPFLDPAESLIEDLSRTLSDLGESSVSRHRLLTTGDSRLFASQIPHFLPGVYVETGEALWTGTHLRLPAATPA